jgi:tetratricopeptide (TPR) repeat protein
MWRDTAAGEPGAVFVGGEPGVGKSRLAGEIARRAHADGGLVLYGRCDEDLAAPLQPFIEAMRVLAPALGAARLRAVRGVDELTRMVPELTELLGEKPGVRADPDTERLALFDAVTQVLVAASNAVPVLLVLDDLHWAGKTTLSLLRHLLRNAKGSRLLVVGTYRDTELARTHPLAETLADLRRDTDPHRITLGGLAASDVAAYLAAIGNTDRALGRELAEITAGNPFFLIEVVRHVEESGGAWQPGSLPEGVREATGRRLSRLSEQANEALAVAAVVGATFDLALVEEVRGSELIDPITEAVAAGLVVEEPGSLARFRFAHAIVRQVLLSELVSLKRVRLHRTIAGLLEAAPQGVDPDERLADLAYHWFECAAAGSAEQAVGACRRAADRAMERLAYEEAGDLYGMALEALEWVDGSDAETAAPLHLARCDALLTAGDVAGASAAIDALELVSAGSERLAAWYTTYAGLLAVLGEPERLTEIVESIGAAAGAMRDAGDLTGEAKARYVHASALERLGRIGDAQRALDAALAAARSADDRRLADAILAEAPPAALWGPSSVTRASGRCLDVVRVLRITSGTPAVEAVALRCQAVLEALRGRMDAARRMIGSSRRTVEQLGLTHRRLETELAAGLIELLDGEAIAAEQYLRLAYEGLRERGLGGEAAQAGAFLGRALLLQDRVDEADEVAAEASALAGSDLKAAITWRDVRAVVAARRGDTDRALTLAHEAVELASATDALLLVADARLTLAAVLRQAGDDDAADAEARRAVEACEAKGATVLAALARDAMGTAIGVKPPSDAPPATIVGNAPEPNLAMAYAVRFQDAFNRADWDAVRADLSPTRKVDDRRPVVGMTVFGYIEEQNHDIHAGGGRFEPPELLATRGDRLALCRWQLRGPGMEVPYLAITRVDADGRVTDYVMFEPEAMDDAVAALNEMAAVDEFENDAARGLRRVGRLFAARDWDAFVATLADDWYLDDRRAIVGGVFDRDQSLASCRIVFDGGGQLTPEILATRGRSLALARMTLHLPDLGASDTVLVISPTNESGRGTRSVNLDPDDLDGAFAALDRLFLEGEGAAHAEVLALGASFIEGLARLDTLAVDDLLAPDFVARDHRTNGVATTGRDEWLAGFDVASDLSGPSVPRVEHLTNLSATGGLWALTGTGDLVGGGPWETSALLAIHVDEHHVVALDLYDVHDVEPARDALAAGPRRSVEWCENDATRSLVRFHAAHHAHDWDALLDTLADDFIHEERRSLMRLSVDRDAAIASIRLVFDGRGRLEYEVLATRGRTLALTHNTIWIPEFEATDEVLAVNCVDDSGRQWRLVMFDADDLEGALAELDHQFLQGEGAEGAATAALGAAPMDNIAWRAALRHRDALNQRDWQAYLDATDPGVVYVDHRRDLGLRLEGAAAFDAMREGFEVDDFRYRRELLATRGEHLAVTRDRAWFVVGNAGPSEVENLTLVESGPDGRVRSHTAFNVDDLDTALAALDARHTELGEPTGNRAWRAAAAIADAQSRGDWPAVAELLDPGYVQVDHRRVLGLRLDTEAAVASQRLATSLGDVSHECTLVVTRGEELAVTRNLFSFIDGEAGRSEVATLGLTECGDDGRVVSQAVFESDQLDAVLAALDARHAELEDAADNLAWRAALALADAQTRRDWQAVLDVLDPGYVYVDCRQGVRLELDGSAAFDVHRTAMDLDDLRDERTLVATRGDRLALTRNRVWFVVGDAGPSEVEALTLIECGPDGRIRVSTGFDPDDLDAAYTALDARHAELTAAVPETAGDIEWFENDAWRAQLRFGEASNRRDWQAVLDVFDPGFVYADLRPGVRLHLEGDDALDAYRSMIALDDCRCECALLATRGERLALTRVRVWFVAGEAGPAEIETASVVECGADGRIVAITSVAPDDVDVALDLLDARYVAQGGPDFAAMRRLFDARDWESFAALHAPDSTIADHRIAGWGDIDRDTFVDYQRSVVELAPDAHLWIDHTRSHGDVAISIGRAFGTQNGGPWEIAFATVGVAGPDGASQHFESYELSDLAIAFRRFGELVAEYAGEAPADASTPADALDIPRNRAARLVQEDGWALLAVLDDDVCLHATPTGFVLHEVDRSGSTVTRTEYASGELRTAADEINRLLQHRTGTPEPAARMPEAINAHDFDAVRSCIDRSCSFEDHREFRVVEFGDVDQHIESLRAGVELAPDYTVLIRRLIAAEAWGLVVLTGSFGTTADGSTFEIAVISLSAWDSTGRLSTMAIFEPNDLDAAVARLHELAP